MKNQEIKCPCCLGPTKLWPNGQYHCQSQVGCGFIFRLDDEKLEEKVNKFNGERSKHWQDAMYPAASFYG